MFWELQPTSGRCPSIFLRDSRAANTPSSDECRACVGVAAGAHVDNLRDKWGGGRSDRRAHNPSLPPGDGDGEITRPDWAACARLCAAGLQSNESPLHPLPQTAASASSHRPPNSSPRKTNRSRSADSNNGARKAAIRGRGKAK